MKKEKLDLTTATFKAPGPIMLILIAKRKKERKIQVKKYHQIQQGKAV